MVPQLRRGKYFYTEGHDVEGKIYRVKHETATLEEVDRTPTNKRLVWDGTQGTANLGIRKFKKQNKDPYMVSMYKQNAWKNSDMKDHIAKSALKAVKKAKKDKGNE